MRSGRGEMSVELWTGLLPGAVDRDRETDKDEHPDLGEDRDRARSPKGGSMI